MGNKSKKGVWSDRRKFWMNALWVLFLLALGKGWDRYQSSPQPPRDCVTRSRVCSVVASSHGVSVVLGAGEAHSFTGVPDDV
jgi:hypothetical protein